MLIYPPQQATSLFNIFVYLLIYLLSDVEAQTHGLEHARQAPQHLAKPLTLVTYFQSKVAFLVSVKSKDSFCDFFLNITPY